MYTLSLSTSGVKAVFSMLSTISVLFIPELACGCIEGIYEYELFHTLYKYKSYDMYV